MSKCLGFQRYFRIITVVHFSFRGDISSVILYDTSQDEDVNINEAILQAVKEDGGGIDTPRTVSPAPGSNPPTPKQVISPVQSSADVRERTGSNQSLKAAGRSDLVQRTSSEKLDSSQSLKSADGLVTQHSDTTRRKSAEKLGSSQNLTPNVESNVSENIKDSEDSSIFLSDPRFKGQSEDNISEHNENKNVPRFTESWTKPSQTNETVKHSKKVDNNSNVSERETSATSLHENLTNTFESLKLSNQHEEVPSTTNQFKGSGHVIEKEPIKSVTASEPKKEWSFDGRTIWNRTEYFKRPLPPNFEIPPIGDYLDIHVNFIHDPSNFVCIPYAMMNELNQLLVDMIEYFHPTPPPVSIVKKLNTRKIAVIVLNLNRLYHTVVCVQRKQMSLVTRKLVFGLSDQVRLKLTCSASEAS